MKRVVLFCLLAFFSVCLKAQESGLIIAGNLFELMDQIDVINRSHGLVESRKGVKDHRLKRRKLQSNVVDSIFRSDTIHILIDNFQGDYVIVLGTHNEFVKGGSHGYYYDFGDFHFDQKNAIDPVYYKFKNDLLLSIIGKKTIRDLSLLDNCCNWLFHYILIKENDGSFRYVFTTYLFDAWTYEIIPIPYHKDSVRNALVQLQYYKEHPDELRKYLDSFSDNI